MSEVLVGAGGRETTSTTWISSATTEVHLGATAHILAVSDYSLVKELTLSITPQTLACSPRRNFSSAVSSRGSGIIQSPALLSTGCCEFLGRTRSTRFEMARKPLIDIRRRAT